MLDLACCAAAYLHHYKDMVIHEFLLFSTKNAPAPQPRQLSRPWIAK